MASAKEVTEKKQQLIANFYANEQDINNDMSIMDDINERYAENHPVFDSNALKQIRRTNREIVSFGQFNINLLRNKCPMLVDKIKGNHRLDESFPTSQFRMQGFAEPYRLDRDKYNCGFFSM